MLRVLIIDDNAQDRFLVERELQHVFPNVRCQHIINETQFAQALEADQFDLVVTDFQLKWSDGLALLHRIKQADPDKPVIMFTGTGNEELAVEAMKAGLDDYVIKSPKHYIRLVAAVRSALEKCETRRRAARAEAERQDLLEREQAARGEAERLLREAKEAERRKDDFLAMLAHELRNPLSPIVNAIHLLTIPQVQNQSIDRLREMLQRQVRHLSRLVDDLLDVSRVTRGKVQLRRQRIDMAQLVRVAAEDHRHLIEAAGLTLKTEVERGPVWTVGDPTRLAQVLGNLLHNSAKFTDRGGRVTVGLSVDRHHQRALVRVEDTGIGIELDMLPRVFETFTQADSSLDRSKGGLGLGLALVKGLVELHGGQAHAASDGAGRGAVFTFWLSLADGDSSPPPASTEAVAGRSLRILIVEDNRDAADSLRMVLELTGHTTEVAYTGSQALEMAKKVHPTVVLCDLGLPGGMSGYDVARALRQDPQMENARLIAISGYGQPEDRERARDAGFDLHLTKPVTPQDLQRILADKE
jgi:signal transduction histidine kinase